MTVSESMGLSDLNKFTQMPTRYHRYTKWLDQLGANQETEPLEHLKDLIQCRELVTWVIEELRSQTRYTEAEIAKAGT